MDVPDAGVTDALISAAAISPFFAVQSAAGDDWVTWSSLVDEGALSARSSEVAEVLRADPGNRAVTSLVHLGLVARLLAPPVGASLLTGVLPAAEEVHLRLTGSNPVPMALSGVSAVPATAPADVAQSLTSHWLGPRVAPLSARMSSHGLSTHVLTGNTISAVAGILTIATRARPDLTDRAAGVLDSLLTSGPLADTGGRRPDGSFRRRSCCLFYRLPGGGFCADCVLDRGRRDP